MHDLNDLYYFAQVVEHGGFAAAGRALDIPKSTLSRRVATLEKRLGVRLLQRSTRHLSVTAIGRRYHEHCRAMLIEAAAAEQVIESAREAPCGLVRVSCPVALLHACVHTMLSDFLAAFPQVSVHLEATNRRVDLIGEGVDVALRVRTLPLEDSSLMYRILAERGRALVASPGFVDAAGPLRTPQDLHGLASLDLGPDGGEHRWHLFGPHGAEVRIVHRPRLVSDDMIALRTAAMAGLGIVQLPDLMVADAIAGGALQRVLPQWAPQRHTVHAVYPSARGQLPSVRALLAHLEAAFDDLAAD